MQSHTDTRTSDESSLQSSLTVAELAQAPDLHLQVVAGRTGLSRVIEAVYIGDLDDPTRWMVQGSVVLTTGPRLEEDPESGAELVRLLKRSGMVGVGVAIMPNVRIIPEVMLAAGDEQGLPVLRVPEETPFRLVTSYVFNALASRDMHRLRRSVAMQQHLVDALLDERSVEALVRRWLSCSTPTPPCSTATATCWRAGPATAGRPRTRPSWPGRGASMVSWSSAARRVRSLNSMSGTWASERCAGRAASSSCSWWPTPLGD